MGKNNCVLDTTQKKLHIRRLYISWGPAPSHPKKKAQAFDVPPKEWDGPDTHAAEYHCIMFMRTGP